MLAVKANQPIAPINDTPIKLPVIAPAKQPINDTPNRPPVVAPVNDVPDGFGNFAGNHKPVAQNMKPIDYVRKHKPNKVIILDGKDTRTTLDLLAHFANLLIVIVECNLTTRNEQICKTKDKKGVSVVHDTIGHYILHQEISNWLLLDYCCTYYGNPKLKMHAFFDFFMALLKLKFADFAEGCIILSVCRRSGKKGFTDQMLLHHIMDDVVALSRILQMEITLTEMNKYVSNVGRKHGAPMLQCVVEYKKGDAIDHDVAKEAVKQYVTERCAVYRVATKFI